MFLPLLLTLAIASPLPSTIHPREPCSRSTLESLTSAYLAAQTSGSPLSGFTLPASAYHENFTPASPTTGLLSRPLTVDNSRSYHDTTTCSTYTELIITAPTPYVIGTQIHLSTDGTTITKLDTIITTTGDWLFNAASTLRWALTESWAPIPASQRDSRAVIQAAADAYLDIFSDKSVVVPWGRPCARLEGGSYTGRGVESDRCDVGIPNGVKLVDRRYVIDEEVGSVSVFLRFGGSGGLVDCHEFRIEGGKIRYVHTLTVT